MLPYIVSLVSNYGLWALAGLVALESVCIPVPAEAALIATAIFAGTTDIFNIWSVIAVATGSAIAGSTTGFWIGRKFGYPPLVKYGHCVRLTHARIKIGQYLVLRHGCSLVFAGRFLPVMRNVVGLVAGVNCMQWPRFMFANATGAVAWVMLYGLISYYLGEQSTKLAGPVLVSTGILLLLLTVGLAALVMRYEKQLEASAMIALPGAL
jgi:membrane protein DedA with SNARE-associated domain